MPNRTLNGAPGRWVVTPLQWAPDQPALLVLRGFIPQAIDDNDAPIDTVEPPSGEVTVRGWLRHTETPEGIQSKKADLGDNRFARIDIERIELARSEQYVPVFLLLGAQDPPTASEAIGYFPLPERSEGAHFSYAIQWAIFTLIAAVGYPLTLRKVAKGKLAEGEGEGEGEGHGDGDSTDAAAEVPADVAAAT